jgi:hypothetical protein
MMGSKGIKRGIVVGVLLGLLGLPVSALAAQQTANWLGGSGSWTDSTKWSGGVVPTNNGTTTFAVNIDNGNPAASAVVLSAIGSGRTIDSLKIDAGDSFRLAGQPLTLGGPLVLNGIFTVDALSSVSLSGDATVTGSGTLQFSANANDQTVFSPPSAGTLTIDSGITVTGGNPDPNYFVYIPTLGRSDATLVNKGQIRMDQPGEFNIAASSINNSQGTIEVSNGGLIVIESNFSPATLGGTLANNGGSFGIGGTLDNSAQTLAVDRPKGWIFQGGMIHGGTVQASNGGTIYVPDLSVGTLDNVASLNATVVVDGVLNVTGTLGGVATIKISNPEAIEAAGVVNIPTVPAGITVRGGLDSSFDDASKGKVNATTIHGTVRAERSIFGGTAKLRLDSPGGAISNDGSLQVSDGGTLAALDPVTFLNNGNLVIDGGGEMDVTGSIDLTAAFDGLDVYPKADGTAYNSYLIATYTGTRSGIFNIVTPGISVNYATPGEIFISGTPVPEPGLVSIGFGGIAIFAAQSRVRRRSARHG